MSNAPETIITDAEIIRIHAYANFGSMTPREVVNDGVRKYAVGYQGGATQMAILREHGLITAPRGYKADLTEKGKRYARSISLDKPTLEAAMELPQIKALLVALDELRLEAWGYEYNFETTFHTHVHDTLQYELKKLVQP